MKNTLRNTVSFLGVVFFLVLLMGSTGPQPQVIDKNISSKIYADKNGEADAGYRATFIVANNGTAGRIHITVDLFCNEGSYKRTETIYLQEGERKQLVYDFPEPSWLSDNVKVFVDAKPVKEK